MILAARTDAMRVDGVVVLPLAWRGANRATESPLGLGRGYWAAAVYRSDRPSPRVRAVRRWQRWRRT